MQTGERALPKRWWLWPLLAGVAARVVSLIGIFYGQLHPAPYFKEHYPLLHDATWYVRIALEGYQGIPPGAPDGQLYDIAFLPLWPVLLRLVSAPFGSDSVVVGLVGAVLASVLSIVGVVVVYRLFWRRYGPDAARGAYLIAFAPAAYAGSLAYGDPLALLLAAAWWWPSLEGRWGIRTLLGFALGLLRLPAIALAIDALWPRGRHGFVRIAPALGVIAGLLLYAGVVAAVTGDPLGILRGTASVTSDHGGKGILAFFSSDFGLFSGLEQRTSTAFIAALGALFAVFGVVALVRRGRRADALVAGTIVAMAVLGGSWPSWWRYLTFALPIYGALGESLGRRRTIIWSGVFMVMLLSLASVGGGSDTHP